ncbi:hypothetical protein KAH27_06150 [bacterium]|nr:hypothetical protein [bacterium]
MKQKTFLIAIVTSCFVAALATTTLASSNPWGHRYDEDLINGQTWEITNVVDNSTLQAAVEWGEGDWDGTMGSAFGMGASTDGSGWTWYELPWFEDGAGDNKRCHADITFSDNGTNWWAYRIIKAVNGGTNYLNGSVDWAESYSPLSASAYVYVIPEPVSIFLMLLGLELIALRK